MNKSDELARIEGYPNPVALIEDYFSDSVIPGICTNPGCDYTEHVEHDCRDGFCDLCQTNTVESAMSLEGII